MTEIERYLSKIESHLGINNKDSIKKTKEESKKKWI